MYDLSPARAELGRSKSLYTERYRSGHNGADSKSRVVADGLPSKKPVFMRVSGFAFAAVFISILQFSCIFANDLFLFFHSP